MRALSLVLALGFAGVALAQSPPPAPNLSPEQMKALPKKLQVKPPPYFFKKDGTPYRAPAVNTKLSAKAQMLQKRASAQLHTGQRPIVPPLHGAFGDWVSFIHEVIHRP